MRTLLTFGTLAALALPLSGCVHEHHHDRPAPIAYGHDECVREYHGGYYAPPPPVVYYPAAPYRVYRPAPRYDGPHYDGSRYDHGHRD